MTLYESEKPSNTDKSRLDRSTVRDGKKGSLTQMHDDSPPPYEEPFATGSSPPPRSHIATQSPQTPSLPCVIPQTSKSFGSPFNSPFTRAYPPTLASHAISQTDFLAFIDGLNEVFISHPLFQSVSAAGTIMQMFHGTAVVQFVGMGLQATSDLSSAATSYMRTKAYLGACNADFFHPAGLHASVLSTKDILARIGHPDVRLGLPPSETAGDLGLASSSVAMNPLGDGAEQGLITPVDVPRTRRLKALEGYIAPLDFDVPAVVPPEGLLAKMSAWQAHRVASKNEQKDAKKHANSQSRQSCDGELREKDGKKLDRKFAKLEKSLDKPDGKRKEKNVRRAQEKYDRTQRKVERRAEKSVEKAEKGKGKVDDKEERQANKIRWIVIDRWRGDEEDAVSDASSLRSEQS